MPTTPRYCRGFTLFELVVVIALVGVLATVALERFRGLQDAAEAAAAEANVAALRGALLIRSTELAAGNRWSEMADLRSQNPFLLLETLPGNYAGEANGNWVPGNWYYVPVESAVLYAVRRSDAFVAGDGGQVMRFGLVGRNGAGARVEGQGVAYVSLLAAATYRWSGRTIQ